MILKRICGVLAAGYILMFYSEHMFWAHVRADNSLSNWLMTWLVYSLSGYVFLALVSRFHVRSIWAIFLCGAVFGWLTEGVVVQTAYQDLPLSLSFTGLAWHAAISVLVGWYMVRKALQTGFRPTLVLSIIIGLIYGLWAISWWNEPGERTTPIIEFAVFALATQVLVISAYWVYDHTIAVSFKPSRLAEMIVGMLILLYFIFVTIPAAPMAAWILPGLLLIVYLTLRRNLKRNGDEFRPLDRAQGSADLELRRVINHPAGGHPGLYGGVFPGTALEHQLDPLFDHHPAWIWTFRIQHIQDMAG